MRVWRVASPPNKVQASRSDATLVLYEIQPESAAFLVLILDCLIDHVTGC